MRVILWEDGVTFQGTSPWTAAWTLRLVNGLGGVESLLDGERMMIAL
jgi:hypothetical protein